MTASGMADLSRRILPDCQPPSAKKQIAVKTMALQAAPLLDWLVRLASELQAQAELQHARPSAAEPRIALSHVGRLRNEARRACIRVDCAVRVNSRCNDVGRQGEVGMIENIKNLGAKLECQIFCQLCVFGNGKVRVPEARAVDLIASQIAEITGEPPATGK